MGVVEHAPPPGGGAPDRRFPPITEVGVGSMICVISGVIYLASYLPRRAPLGVPVGLLAAGAVLLLANVLLLVRLKDFAWFRFFQVARWGLLAFTVARFERGRAEAGEAGASP